MCYGPEMTAQALRKWLEKLGTKTLYIAPGSPWENGFPAPYGWLRHPLSGHDPQEGDDEDRNHSFG
jgi:hypothetical protein